MNDQLQARDRPVRITLDGRALTIAEDKPLAGDILRLGGLDPANYDLAEVRRGQAEPKRYKDSDKVNLKEGDAFLTIRHSAQVA